MQSYGFLGIPSSHRDLINSGDQASLFVCWRNGIYSGGQVSVGFLRWRAIVPQAFPLVEFWDFPSGQKQSLVCGIFAQPAAQKRRGLNSAFALQENPRFRWDESQRNHVAARNVIFAEKTFILGMSISTQRSQGSSRRAMGATFKRPVCVFRCAVL